MIPLHEAVYSQLRTAPPIIALVGSRIYAGRALNNMDMPYIVFSRQGSFPPVYYTTRTMQVERAIMRFHIFSTDQEEAASGVEGVETLFRMNWPALSAGTVMQVTRQGDDLIIDPTPTGDGDDVWHGVIDLDFMLQRNPS